MKVLILAGGYGTRLYPLVKNTSKALLDVQGKPIIDYTLDKVRDVEDLKQILVVTNDKFHNDFEKWSEERSSYPASIKVINDGTKSNEDRLGSIGDIDFVLNCESIDDDLLVVGGDNIFDFNLSEYIAFAQGNVPGVTIGAYDIHSIEDASKFGVVELGDDGKVISFEEKPEKPKSSLIAMCFYYLSKQSLGFISQYIKESQKADKAGEYIRWLSEKNDVYGFNFKGKWYDIGSIESYEEAQKNFS